MTKNEKIKIREIYKKVYKLSLLKANNPCDTKALSSIARKAVDEAKEILDFLEPLAFYICESCGARNREKWQVSKCKKCGRVICYQCDYHPEESDSDKNICWKCWEKEWEKK